MNTHYNNFSNGNAQSSGSWQTIRSKTNQVIWIRPLNRDDAPLLIDIFEHMGSMSRYQRFQQTLDQVSERRVLETAETIVVEDGSRKWGLIAFDGPPSAGDNAPTPIGSARYIELDSAEVEVAISLRDDYHGLGIGKQLMRLVADHAHDAGVERIIASIQNNNPAIWQIFAKLPYRVTRTPEGNLSDIVIYLQEPLIVQPSPASPSEQHSHL